MPATIELAVEKSVARLRLVPSRPEKPPTLDLGALEQLARRVEQIGARADEIRLAVVESAATRYFCVGADIDALRGLDERSIVDWVAAGNRALDCLADAPVPTLALVRGYALGGGLEVALACDMIVAHPEARLGLPETTLGLVPGWGGIGRVLDRCGPSVATRLACTAEILDAAEAERVRLVDRVTADAEAFVDATRDRLERTGARAVARAKRLIRDALDAPERCRGEQRQSALCMADPDTQQRLAAFFASRLSRSSP